ncbi:MAG: GNAT family N-acetyltransferase [Nitrosopumilus sp.]|nr:GNAT family N-acetyltransferase [Nitrosopumilus sp.]
MPGIDVELREIRADDKLTGLKLGDAEFAPLKTFLQKHSKKFHANDLAKSYALFAQEGGNAKVIGYITLLCGEVVTDERGGLLEADLLYKYPSYPAVKIARLAVDVRYQRGRGLGTNLVEFALGLVKQSICPAIGCRFMVVDAKKKSVPFYEKRGFTLLDTEANKKLDAPVMFIDLTKISI